MPWLIFFPMLHRVKKQDSIQFLGEFPCKLENGYSPGNSHIPLSVDNFEIDGFAGVPVWWDMDSCASLEATGMSCWYVVNGFITLI